MGARNPNVDRIKLRLVLTLFLKQLSTQTVRLLCPIDGSVIRLLKPLQPFRPSNNGLGVRIVSKESASSEKYRLSRRR